MIGRLSGTLVQKEPPSLLIDVGGVGYELEAPMTTFYDLPARGERVTLYTHLVVRDDAHLLYGFSSERQRRLFRYLIRVNGVGPRVALAVLSGLSEQEFVQCIADNNLARLTQVPGIGKKTAERLIIEMRDKVSLGDIAVSATGVAHDEPTDPVSDAVSALMALGYKAQEASRLVRTVDTRELSTEEIIRQALKRMAG